MLDAIDQCLQVGIKQRPQNISELRLLLNGDYDAGKVADDGLNKTRKVTQDEAGFDEELAESEETRESKEDQEIFNNASPIPGKTKGLRAVALCILVVVLGVGVYLGYQSYPRLGESAISTEAAMDQMPDDLSLVGEFVVVPGGEFSMGDNDGGELEKPERIVSVRSFKLAKHEVTREQFARFVEDAGFTTDASRYGCYVYKDGKHGRYMGPSWKTPGIDQQDNHPVVCVSYFDALAYIEWLNEKTGNSYRLPTEAEWEYAARAGRKEPSEFTIDPDQACKVGNSADMEALKVFSQWTYTSFCSDGYAVTAPVGSYAANGFGLKDMLGNVWEWNADCIHSNYIGAPVDGSARTEGCDNTARVRRGGAWNLTLKYFSETVRTGFSSAASINDTGFRLAEDL